MSIALATAPSSTSKPNEDWVGGALGALVVLDGLTTPPGQEATGCRHGTPWFVRNLGSRYLSYVAADPEGSPLADALHKSITDVVQMHATTCDLAHPASPAAGVAAIRITDDRLEFLVLYDAFVIVDTGDQVHVYTDLRGQEAVADLRRETFSHPIDSEGHARARRAMVASQREQRNQPDGFWLAASDTEAANHANVGAWPLAEIRRAAVLSDGAAALVEYDKSDWKGLLDILEQAGPEQLIQKVREAEAEDPDGIRWPRFKTNDDATAAFWAP